jgi:hypothetical protein
MGLLSIIISISYFYSTSLSSLIIKSLLCILYLTRLNLVQSIKNLQAEIAQSRYLVGGHIYYDLLFYIDDIIVLVVLLLFTFSGDLFTLLVSICSLLFFSFTFFYFISFHDPSTN